MTNFHYNGRREVAALLCLYMIVINGLAMGNPPEVDTPGDEKKASKGIAFYAGDEYLDRKLMNIDVLYFHYASLGQSLSDIVSAPRDFNASAVLKRDQKFCATLMRDMERVRHEAKEYLELKRLIDEYKDKIGEFRQEGVTPERKAELSAAIENLELDFKDKVHLTLDDKPCRLLGYFAHKITDAEEVIKIYKGDEPLTSEFSFPVPGGVIQICDFPWSDKNASQPADVSLKSERSESPFLNSCKECPCSSEESSSKCFTTIDDVRKYLADRSLLTRMETLKNRAKDIIDALRSPSMIASYTKEPDNGCNCVLNKHKCHMKKCYDKLCYQLQYLLVAWSTMKRYNDISNKLGEMDPKSPEAIELEKQKNQLERKFVFYGCFVNEETLAKNEQALMQMWDDLKIKVEELERKDSSQTSHITGDGMAELSSNNAAESETTDTDRVEAEAIKSVSNNMRSV